MISTRSVELVIDTVVCLTLAKWKTVSGQFGGYLMGCPRVRSSDIREVPLLQMENRLQRSHSTPHDPPPESLAGERCARIFEHNAPDFSPVGGFRHKINATA